MNKGLSPATRRVAETPLIYLSKHYIRAKEHLEAIVASTSDAICTTDMRGKVIFFSPGAERMTGLLARDIVGLPVHRIYEGGRQEAEKIMALLLDKGVLSNYETVIRASNKRVNVSMSASVLRDRLGRPIGTLGISKDITERVELERRLRELSITDDLTGLFNHRHFLERCGVEIQRAVRQKHPLCLVLIDLDGFKKINDQKGHLEGDKTLVAVSRAIQASIRRGVDAGFRYGGDEFVLLLPGTDSRKADLVLSRVREFLSSESSPVSMSVGVSYLRPGDDPGTLLHRADLRMYAVKRRSKSAPLF